MKVALVGNPNSGKSSLFNALTGAKQYVGNWPGVTVEKKRRKNEEESDNQDSRFTWNLFPVTLYT